nr:hypothetical protein [Scytonema sp. HK-05]
MHTHDTDLAIVVDDEAFGMDSTYPNAACAATPCPTVRIKQRDLVLAQVND